MSSSHTSPSSNNISGFSLVELSIVLVILGLLTGGILTGQSLIRAAELRAVPTEFNQFQTAVQTFKGKYFALPGDITNATAFWGAAHATPATCLTTVGTGTQTCNGNGNGQINNAAAVSQYSESFMAWQHLVNAGLLEGTYTGRASSTHRYHGTFGINAPKSKLSNAGWWLHPFDVGTTTGSLSAHVNHYDGNYRNWMLFSSDPSSTLGVLTPQEAWNIDTKVDDGKATMGKVVSGKPPLAPNCTTGSASTDDYKLSETSNACHLEFRDVL